MTETERRDLERRAVAVLQQMRFVAEGAVASFPDAIEETPPSHRIRRRPDERPRQRIGKASHRQHGESRPPHGEESLHDHWSRRLRRACDIGGEALKMAVAEAEIALRAARHSAEDLRADDERSRMIIESEVGVDPYRVAAKYRCSANHVRTLRARWPFHVDSSAPADPRDPETGERKELSDRDIKIATARELASTGLPVRAIAIRLGVPKSTVGDWLNHRQDAA